jgi:hypothetical protein
VRPVARRVHNEHPVMVSAHITNHDAPRLARSVFSLGRPACVVSRRSATSLHARAICRKIERSLSPRALRAQSMHSSAFSRSSFTDDTLRPSPVSRWFRIPIMPRRFSSSSKFSGKSAWNKTRARGHNDTIAIPGEQRVRAELEAVGAFDEDKIGRHIANPGKCALQPHAQLR